jgi:hypothetical protein
MQSKFLNLVEDNTPDDSVDRNTKAKLTVLRALVASSEEVKIKNKQLTNVFFFTDIEGNEYKVSIDNVGVENNEDVVDVAKIATDGNEEVKKAKVELNNKLVQRMRKLTDQIK